MPASPSLFKRFGGLELPLSDSATLLDTDPVRDVLLGLFEAAINAELGPAWRRVTAGMPGDQLSKLNPVAKTYGFEPKQEFLQQLKVGWPFLALHRSGTANHEPHTLESERITQPWTLHYILPPLEIGDQHKVGNVFQAVAKIVTLVVRERSHPAYQDGAVQFFGSLDPDEPGTVAQLGALRVVSHEFGQAVFSEGADAVHYPALEMTLESVEYSGANQGAFGEFEAVDYSASVTSEDGRAADLVLGQTDAEFQP